MPRLVGPITLASRAATIDIIPPQPPADAQISVRTRGGGQRCGYCGERAGTRVAGWTQTDLWRCEACPDPPPLGISPEIDPTERDPHKRWPRTSWRSVANTGRHDRNDLENETA